MTGSCPCERAVALADAAERILAAMARSGAAPAGTVDAWLREYDSLVCPCHDQRTDVGAGAGDAPQD